MSDKAPAGKKQPSGWVAASFLVFILVIAFFASGKTPRASQPKNPSEMSAEELQRWMNGAQDRERSGR